MKKLILLSAFALSCLITKAQTPQDTSWKKGGFIGLNFSQVNLSKWAPGGENSVAMASNVNLFANYVKDKNEWSNSLDLSYALIKSGSQKVRKNDDKIDFNSKYSRKFAAKWSYGILLNFKSQFAPGYLYPDDSTVVSKFLAPGYITVAPGITYKPVDYFEAFFSPATGKFTIVNDQILSDARAYGVDSGKKVRSEFGAYLNLKFKKDIWTNVSLTSKLELFNNYTDKDKDNAKKVDVNWDTALNMKVNEYLTVTVNTVVVYDANIVETTQFKELLGIGLGVKF